MNLCICKLCFFAFVGFLFVLSLILKINKKPWINDDLISKIIFKKENRPKNV